DPEARPRTAREFARELCAALAAPEAESATAAPAPGSAAAPECADPDSTHVPDSTDAVSAADGRRRRLRGAVTGVFVVAALLASYAVAVNGSKHPRRAVSMPELAARRAA